MPIRHCQVIAVEGTHSSGKTTLMHALTSHYRERGMHVGCVEEPARSSPFIEEIVLHDKGTFDVIAELDVFAQQITSQLRAARHYAALIVDKTPINVVAYAKMLLTEQDASVIDAMFQLCLATAALYDAVIYATDVFNPHQPGDDLRSKVADSQREIDARLRDLLVRAGLAPIDLPQGMTTAQRVEWASGQLEDMGLMRAVA